MRHYVYQWCVRWESSERDRGRMAIDRDRGVRRASVGEVLAEDLSIPPYQRPYSWQPTTAVQLLDDIRAAFRGREQTDVASAVRPNACYVLGAVILHRDEDAEKLNVVDGQQRLLTLTILLELLDQTSTPNGVDVTLSASDDPAAPIVVARQRLASRVSLMEDDPGRLADFVRGNCQLIRVETDDADEAFRVFDSQNYRGKALLPHDLLKAHHVREMHDETETMKAALVEVWESVADNELDRLFSTYLWRIRQWSRGFSSPAFASRHVEAFKGITMRDAHAPSSRYHLAAQTAVPLLAAWTTLSDEGEREAARTRFQLDAPTPAGRPFFEMVTFMLAELKRLRLEGYSEEGWDDYASTDRNLSEEKSRAKYRYVSELYLAALLYYTNKFGDLEIVEAKRFLFRWAYSLRTELQRVQMVSINNHAKNLADGQSAFVLLRNADKPTDLRRLSVDVRGRDQTPEHMKALLDLLKGLGG